MQISIKSDVKKLQKKVGRLFADQIPFALSGAINATAFDVMKAEKAALVKQIDNPTPFTKSGIRVKKGNKRRPNARIFIADIQNEYLDFQIEGGTRQPKRRANAIATTHQRVNRYGNKPKGLVQRLKNKPKHFSGKPKGGNRPAGIWQRTNRNKKLKPLIIYGGAARYRRKYGFYETGHKEIQKVFSQNFIRAFNRAVRTAR